MRVFCSVIEYERERIVCRDKIRPCINWKCSLSKQGRSLLPAVIHEIAFSFSSASFLALWEVFGLLIALYFKCQQIKALKINGRALRFQATLNICDVVGVIVLAAYSLFAKNRLFLANFLGEALGV